MTRNLDFILLFLGGGGRGFHNDKYYFYEIKKTFLMLFPLVDKANTFFVEETHNFF